MNTLSANLQSLLDNRLRYLPPIVGAAIGSVDWSAELIDIGRHFGLHVDEMEDFQAVVLKAMIGLIQPADFERELIAALALSPANADKIIHAVNARVFEPIHDYVVRGGAVSAETGALQQAGIHIEPHLDTVEPMVVQNSSKLIPVNTHLDVPSAAIEFGGVDTGPGLLDSNDDPYAGVFKM